MKLLNPDKPLTEDGRAEVIALAKRQRSANGLLMKAINFVGSQLEDALKALPKGFRSQVDSAARVALEQSYLAASKSRSGSVGRGIAGDRVHKVVATISGAIGGIGGLPTALAELPIATTLIFRAVQDVAQSHGEDPATEETRIQCLQVFGAGGPGAADDGIDTSFVGAKLGLTGTALNNLIARVAPRFSAVLTQKLAAQTVPILGAAAGAGASYAFIDYYTEIAHVHFGLRKLARDHDEDQVLAAFHAALNATKVTRN